MAAACHILSSDVGHARARTFPLSRTGWTSARDHAYKVRNLGGAAYVTLVCPGKGGIPLYQCYRGQGCQIEGSDGDEVLAGARRRRRR